MIEVQPAACSMFSHHVLRSCAGQWKSGSTAPEELQTLQTATDDDHQWMQPGHRDRPGDVKHQQPHTQRNGKVDSAHYADAPSVTFSSSQYARITRLIAASMLTSMYVHSDIKIQSNLEG